MKLLIESAHPPRPAARAIRQQKGEEAFGDSVRRPYLHLVDGAGSDTLGMRSVAMPCVAKARAR
jgi:NTE family protein